MTKYSLWSTVAICLSYSVQSCSGRNQTPLAFFNKKPWVLGKVRASTNTHVESKLPASQKTTETDALLQWTNRCHGCLLASFAMMAIPWRQPSTCAALLPTFLLVSISGIRGELQRLGFISAFGPFVSSYILLLMNPQIVRRIAGCDPRLYSIPAAVAGLYGVILPESAADDIGLELHTDRRRKTLPFTSAMVMYLALLYLTKDTSAQNWVVAATILVNVWRQMSLHRPSMSTKQRQQKFQMKSRAARH